MVPKITYRVTRGKKAGSQLTPRKHASGQYVVSKTRFKEDCEYVDDLDKVLKYLKAGYKVRVSDPATKSSPSFVRLESLEVSEQ
ncbi:hypothetical protein [Endozoicomonas sp. ISHI1]|uniref:hypothetical protein n=1 Tax=Endozoicomonas sp. ISHI1 TaxID=2825882 RepID=UPI0021491AED|nr:hypothetical protein [Endozoicomonas sp. ISHI1]